jgi:hydrogenase expression/formation protein HypE
MGEVNTVSLITTSGAKPGDLVFLTKGIPIEGIAIIAAEKGEHLIKEGVAPKVISNAKNFLYNPGISVVKDSQIATMTADITSMHDPTEGGLSAGLNELALAADVSIAINKGRIPIYPEGETLCKFFDIDPIGTIASGALLFTSSPEFKESLETAFKKEGIPLTAIGAVEEASSVRVYFKEGASDGTGTPLPYIERDEILKVFE